jgi:dihydrofolate synthase/folylpolyglutamate synthase
VTSPPLADAIAWLDRHVNLEATAGRIEGLSLERMHRLVDVLGEPQRAYPVIHLTGTNGKGSTARLITALLAESGLSVGTYTSPHLQRVNERLSRNGEVITDEDLAAVLTDLQQLEPLVGVTNSYFELLTAAAFRWFAEIAVDVAVVEVGLLGRYDATNVADGLVAVLTNVGHDHSDFVGDWRTKVADEKAGIVKPGSTFVVGETDPELLPVFERAGADADATWYRDFDFGLERNDLAIGGRLLDVRTPSGVYEEVFLPLHGAHQGDNAAIALAAAEAFFGDRIADEVVAEAFARTKTPGRFEVVRREPLVVLDGAHNSEGAAAAAETMYEDFSVTGDVLIVVGFMAPRDPIAVLSALEVERSGLVIACEPASPRAVAASDVASAAEELGASAVVEPDVARAVDRALATAGSDDAVLVTGSLYVVGAARTHLVG